VGPALVALKRTRHVGKRDRGGDTEGEPSGGRLREHPAIGALETFSLSVRAKPEAPGAVGPGASARLCVGAVWHRRGLG
jgi:hypothetical protein